MVLMAGLINGLAATAFAEIGFRIGQNGFGEIGERARAHATVGRASALPSGGNSGKGAHGQAATNGGFIATEGAGFF